MLNRGNMNKKAKIGLKYIGIIVGGGVLGLLLMIGVYLLPTGRMKNNVAASHETFNYEGIYPQLIQGVKTTQLDNYTDALMYATAIHPGSGNVVVDALENARFEYQDTKMTQALNDYANDVSIKESLKYEMIYPRYWHGYLVVLKPLLFFLDVSEIRMFNLIVQGSLFVLLLYLVRRKLGECYQIPLLMMAGILNPITLPLSLQFSWVWYIALIGAIAALLLKEPCENQKYLFLVLGMLTSYMDLLTYPLITFGLPAVLLLLCIKKNGSGSQIKYLMTIGVSWGIGYAAMWAEKWTFAGVFGGIDIWGDVTAKIQSRSSMFTEEMEALSLIMVIKKVISPLVSWPYLVLILLFIIYFSVLVFYKRNKKLNLTSMLPFAVVAFLPFAWYAVFSNHSYEHYWFTYRALAVTVLAASVGLIELLNCDKWEELKNG